MALFLVVLPLVVGQEDSGPVCSQRVLQLRESRANSNLTISVRTRCRPKQYVLFLLLNLNLNLCQPIVQKPEKLSVGSMLLVVTVMAVGACLISLAFGKLSVILKVLMLWVHITLLQDIVYDKPKTLDSTFDAGGDTASALIAVSNMCEFINIQTILGEPSFNLRHNSSEVENLFQGRRFDNYEPPKQYTNIIGLFEILR